MGGLLSLFCLGFFVYFGFILIFYIFILFFESEKKNIKLNGIGEDLGGVVGGESCLVHFV